MAAADTEPKPAILNPGSIPQRRILLVEDNEGVGRFAKGLLEELGQTVEWAGDGQPERDRAARYKEMFGRTHAFLLERNGLRPNTLHVALHACTAATLALLAAAAIERTAP